MKKQQKQLILMVLCLVLLLAAWFGIKQYNKQQSRKEAEPIGEAVYNLNAEDVIKITYQNESETNSFVLEEGTWYYEEDRSLAVNQYNLECMAENCAEMRAEQTIKEVTDMSQYGLGEDARTISFETAEESHIFLVGDNNSMSDVYYVRELNGTTVYAVNSEYITEFNYTLDEIITESTEETESTETAEVVEEEAESTEGAETVAENGDRVTMIE